MTSLSAVSSENILNSRRSVTTITSLKLNIISSKIEKLINELKILNPDRYRLQVAVGQRNDSTSVTFGIVNHSGEILASSSAIYFIEDTGHRRQELCGRGQGVSSTLSSSTGTFLFYLQLLLAFLSNVQNFDLDNFTDDPTRAAAGIYKMLELDPRGLTGEERTKLTIHATEGKMRLRKLGDFGAEWEREMRKLAEKIARTKPLEGGAEEDTSWPWNPDVESLIVTFIAQIKQNYRLRGGRKSRRYRRKKSRKRTKRRRGRKRRRTRRGKH